MGWPQPEATLAKEPVTASQIGIFFQNYWVLGKPVLLEIGGGKKKSGFFLLPLIVGLWVLFHGLGHE